MLATNFPVSLGWYEKRGLFKIPVAVLTKRTSDR